METPLVACGATFTAEGLEVPELRPGVWVFVWRGHGGSGPPGTAKGGRIDVWAYLDEDTALRAAAAPLVEATDDDPEAVRLHKIGDFRGVIRRYNEMEGDGHRFADVVPAAFDPEWTDPAALA